MEMTGENHILYSEQVPMAWQDQGRGGKDPHACTAAFSSSPRGSHMSHFLFYLFFLLGPAGWGPALIWWVSKAGQTNALTISARFHLCQIPRPGFPQENIPTEALESGARDHLERVEELPSCLLSARQMGKSLEPWGGFAAVGVAAEDPRRKQPQHRGLTAY